MELHSASLGETGFDPDRLDRIAGHLERHYIGPGKIAGCQVAVARHGHLASYPSVRKVEKAFAQSETAVPLTHARLFSHPRHHLE